MSSRILILLRQRLELGLRALGALVLGSVVHLVEDHHQRFSPSADERRHALPALPQPAAARALEEREDALRQLWLWLRCVSYGNGQRGRRACTVYTCILFLRCHHKRCAALLRRRFQRRMVGLAATHSWL